MFNTEDVYDELPGLRLALGDPFHIRLYARGYDAGRSAHKVAPDGEPVELHLLHAWRT